MNNRTTLTKSLHTVSVVSAIAHQYFSTFSERAACREALRVLGLPMDWADTDPTFAACVAKVAKMRGGK